MEGGLAQHVSHLSAGGGRPREVDVFPPCRSCNLRRCCRHVHPRIPLSIFLTTPHIRPRAGRCRSHGRGGLGAVNADNELWIEELGIVYYSLLIRRRLLIG